MVESSQGSSAQLHGAKTARRILIVDDSSVDRALYRQMLKDPDGTYSVAELGSAEEALQHLKAEPLPDCVLLDHCLPGMTGVDLLRKWSGAGGGVPVPVVMLTAMSDDLLTFRAMQAGASAILSKAGLSALALRAAVNTAIQLELPRKQRILEAEFEYASVATTGQSHEPTPSELAQFAIALEFVRFVRVLRKSDGSLIPKTLRQGVLSG